VIRHDSAILLTCSKNRPKPALIWGVIAQQKRGSFDPQIENLQIFLGTIFLTQINWLWPILPRADAPLRPKPISNTDWKLPPFKSFKVFILENLHQKCFHEWKSILQWNLFIYAFHYLLFSLRPLKDFMVAWVWPKTSLESPVNFSLILLQVVMAQGQTNF